jgi:predicted regulator of Ras-like GTPase activity (Roadblock/LC7/MglB family)
MFGLGKRDAVIESALARLAADLPDVRSVALLTTGGLFRGCWPSVKDEDRLAAMSAATLSLGERVINELRFGKLRYALLAGELGWHWVIVLNEEFILVFDVRPGASLDGLFSAIQHSLPPACLDLGIQLPTNWKLTS